MYNISMLLQPRSRSKTEDEEIDPASSVRKRECEQRGGCTNLVLVVRAAEGKEDTPTPSARKREIESDEENTSTSFS